MVDFYVWPVMAEVIGDETTMTVMRRLFAAQQTTPVQQLPRRAVLNVPTPHQVEKLPLVQLPITLMFLVRVKDFLRRRKLRNMHLIDSANRFRKLTAVVPFG